jgi:predicted Zn-dependent protease
MKHENRLPAEGINSSAENPLKEFAWLLGGSLALMALAVIIVSYGAQWLAPRIPYRYEARLAAGIDLAAAPQAAPARAAQAELQALANRLAARMALPEGMQVRVGFRDEPVVNAFATLGGQTVFFRGLLAKLNSEDAVAMVLAHEIAHLKYRHPASAMGRGVAVGVLMSVVSAELGRSAAGGAVSQAGVFTLLSFNRDQERQADEEALRVVAEEYGHLAGAVELFAVFGSLQSEAPAAMTQVEFLHTHPLTASRTAAVAAWAQARGVPLAGAVRPLPPALAALRRGASAPR